MPGTAAQIIASGVGPQSAAINSQFGYPLVAQVLDASGNPVSGVTVTFVQRGGTSVSVGFAGGVNTAVTDSQGKATSGVITAGSVVGGVILEAWVGSGPVSGAVGPAVFSLQVIKGGPITPGYGAKISTAWTTAKADLSTALSAITTLVNALATLEGDRDALYNLGANDVADWIALQIQQARVGYQPRPSAGSGQPPQVLMLQAPDPNAARNATIVDTRPVSSTPTGSYLGLS